LYSDISQAKLSSRHPLLIGFGEGIHSSMALSRQNIFWRDPLSPPLPYFNLPFAI
jgi:hypothetical protein